MPPWPVIPNHSASRIFHSIKSLLARCGFNHFTIDCKDEISGAISGFSNRTFKVLCLTNPTPARSSSGPKGAILFSELLPINPATRELSSQSTAKEYQRSSGSLVNHKSKADVGKI